MQKKMIYHDQRKKNLIILWGLNVLKVLLYLLLVVAVIFIPRQPHNTILSKTIDWLIFILVQVLSIYIGYRIRLHKKKYMKSERREKCCREEK